jgi:hypothetical protein
LLTVAAIDRGTVIFVISVYQKFTDMKTNSDKNKTKEPFRPEKTPNPPQAVDPNIRNERNENNAPVEDPKRNAKGGQQQKDSGKRLGESEIEIDDETTI